MFSLKEGGGQDSELKPSASNTLDKQDPSANVATCSDYSGTTSSAALQAAQVVVNGN